MAKVGDRIRLSSMKGPDREGVVTEVMGSLLRVRWASQEETTFAPAPGTLTVLAAAEAAPGAAATKKAAAGGKKSASKAEGPSKQQKAKKTAKPDKRPKR